MNCNLYPSSTTLRTQLLLVTLRHWSMKKGSLAERGALLPIPAGAAGSSSGPLVGVLFVVVVVVAVVIVVGNVGPESLILLSGSGSLIKIFSSVVGAWKPRLSAKGLFHRFGLRPGKIQFGFLGCLLNLGGKICPAKDGCISWLKRK